MKKTQAQKNSKLKQNLEKTQTKSGKKLKNRQLQFSIQTLFAKFSPCGQFESTVQILQSQYFFPHNTDMIWSAHSGCYDIGQLE